MPDFQAPQPWEISLCHLSASQSAKLRAEGRGPCQAWRGEVGEGGRGSKTGRLGGHARCAHPVDVWDTHRGEFPRSPSFLLSARPSGHLGSFQLSSFFSHLAVLFGDLLWNRWHSGCPSWTRQRSLPPSRSWQEPHAQVSTGRGKVRQQKGKTTKSREMGVGWQRHKERRYFSSTQEYGSQDEFRGASLGLWVMDLPLCLCFCGQRERDKFYSTGTWIPPLLGGSMLGCWLGSGVDSPFAGALCGCSWQSLPFVLLPFLLYIWIPQGTLLQFCPEDFNTEAKSFIHKD